MVRRRRIRFALLVAGFVCASATGCFGGSGNPRYFPYYLPPGDVIPTHAKPAGTGYFKDFDPKACRLELTPAQCSVATKSQQVLIASVLDKDGNMRRKRRVEWMIDGPGYIVEVDESGIVPGRGYKVDNKYAVSYTDHLEHTITRGNEDPRDDFTIRPGQTWCIVSSAVEGLTTVTAYAPEIHDRDKGLVTSKLTWSDSQGGFPPPVISRSGSKASPQLALNVEAPKSAAVDRDTPIALTVSNTGKAESQPVTVKATLPEGAEFVSADPAPTIRQGRDLSWTIGSIPAESKQAIALVVNSNRKGTLVLNATAVADGLEAKHRAEVQIDSAGLKVTIEPGAVIATGEKATVKLTVTNTGAVLAENVTAWLGFDAGLEHPSGTNPTELALGAIPPGESKKIEVPLTARQTGKFAVRVTATGDGGITARTDSSIEARKQGLFVNVVGPEKLSTGQEANYEITVTNPGDVAFDHVDVRAALPAGLSVKSASPKGQSEGSTAAVWRLGNLKPQGKETLRLVAIADKAMERKNLTLSATGTTNTGSPMTAAADAPVEVSGAAALMLELADTPGVLSVGKTGTMRITVRNRGNGPAKKIEVAVNATDEIAITGGTGADRKPGSVDGKRLAFGLIDELPAGAVAVFVVNWEASQPGAARVQVEVRADHLAKPLREEVAARVVSGS